VPSSPIKPGFCFRLRDLTTGEWSHLWVAITAPTGPEDSCLCANITDRKSFDDDSCILQAGEHPFLRFESVVAYSKAKVYPLGRLKSHPQVVEEFDPFRDELVKRIQLGGKSSDFISPSNRRLIEAELGP